MSSPISVVLLLLLTIFLTLPCRSQGLWPYPFVQSPTPLPYGQQGFVPISGGQNMQQQESFQQFHGNNYENQLLDDTIPTLPRMQLARIQLFCDVSTNQQFSSIRWVRQDSTAITGTAVTIADGYQSADPQQFTVTMENVNGGSLRSILTILQPNPDSSQAAFYCQQAFKNGQVFQSRNVYVYGNRNFVNANMAYHAAETFPTYPASRSGVYPVVEAIQLVVTPNPHRFNNSDLRYHD